MKRKSFRALSEPIMNDEMRRARAEKIGRAMEMVVALAKLKETPCETQTQESAGGASTLSVGVADSLFLATLRQGVEELGGRLEVSAIFPDRRVALID